MIGAIKDSWLFSKASTCAMQKFGIDLMKADKATDGLVNQAVKEARRYKFTTEETAASCVVIASLGLVELLDLDGQKPDYSKMHEIEKTIMFMRGTGQVREPVWERIAETLDEYYALLERKTGVKHEYPQQI